ncbi:MAG: 16S rRNA (guanine(966)-N(2))-methyltransferase RsmD [Pseudomonadota bacterium]|nr:16S rRNA (guanine(966)-N(2))-methyltransferase RsmD [Pseudomonadota bacterium]
MKQSSSANVRIIGGMWRHRKVAFPSHFTIRPSPDRVRETLFNWLQGDIAGRRCLEPFAGSGILSFEALSRGAARVTLADTVPGVVSSLKTEAAKLGALTPACDIRLADGYALLKAPPPLADLVFLDPPFAEARFEELFEALSAEARYPDHLLVYVESAAPVPEPSYASFGFEPIKQKHAGRVTFALFARCA